MLIAWSMLQMKGYGQVALRAVADSLDFLVDMKVYFAVLDDHAREEVETKKQS